MRGMLRLFVVVFVVLASGPGGLKAGASAEDAAAFVKGAEATLLKLWIDQERAHWVKATYITHDTEIIAKYVLMSSRDAGKVAAKAFVHKMALVHIREKPQELLDAMIDEIKKDFDGEVVIGEDLLQILG